MAKSTSSSQKVARVARSSAGKRRVRERPKLGFPIGIFIIVLVGALLVFYSRNERTSSASASEAPVANKDHWHVAYGIYVCDKFLPALTDAGEDKNGIHTHGDGIIHTHPFVSAASGNNARLKVFADQVGMKLGSDSITLPDGTVYNNSFQCNGKPAKVYVYRWDKADDPNATAEVFDKDFGQIRIKNDRSAVTFAVVPEGTDVPRPNSIPELDKLTDVDQGATASTVPGASVPGISVPGASAPTASTPTASTPTASTPAGATPSVSTAGGAAPTDAVPSSTTPGAAPSSTAAPAK